jgi:hypothetical protein
MTGIETVLTDIDAVERDLDRRAFLKAVLVVFFVPVGTLDDDDERFFMGVAATLVPKNAFRRAGIDPLENLRHLLHRTSADHRQRIGRLITTLRRVSFLYGREQVAIRGRSSHFMLMQKASRALASLCLLCFWGDPRSFALIDDPGALT